MILKIKWLYNKENIITLESRTIYTKRLFFKCILRIFVGSEKWRASLMKTHQDYREESSEMQTICFPTLPPVIMDWNATPMFSKPFATVSLIFSFPSLNH